MGIEIIIVVGVIAIIILFSAFVLGRNFLTAKAIGPELMQVRQNFETQRRDIRASLSQKVSEASYSGLGEQASADSVVSALKETSELRAWVLDHAYGLPALVRSEVEEGIDGMTRDLNEIKRIDEQKTDSDLAKAELDAARRVFANSFSARADKIRSLASRSD